MASRLETTRSLDYQPPTPLCSQQCFYTFCFVLFMWWAGNCSITESLPELITGAPEARFNIYARCTSNGSVQTVLYLQYGTSSKVPDSYAYQSLFIVP